jgi:biopolymer transport protein ExbB
MFGSDLNTMLLQGWPVLGLLALMSIFSVTIMLDRFLALRRAGADAPAFIAQIGRMIADDSLVAARHYCRRRTEAVAIVAAAVLAQPGGRRDWERALQHALQAQIRELETFVPVLGTIASTAPFVGLFGTVSGIIRAFADISRNVGGGPEVVAAGISEALVTTAAGLLVAIPALAGYNYFVRRIQRLTEEIDLAAYELIEALAEQERGRAT